MYSCMQMLLAFQTLFLHQHDSYPDVAPHLLCVALITLNLIPVFHHLQWLRDFSRTAKVTGIQQTRPQRKCVSSCSTCYFCSFGGRLCICVFLFLELEFALGLQRLIVRGTQIVQECCHVSLCHSNFTHKTLLYRPISLSRRCEEGRLYLLCSYGNTRVVNDYLSYL